MTAKRRDILQPIHTIGVDERQFFAYGALMKIIIAGML